MTRFEASKLSLFPGKKIRLVLWIVFLFSFIRQANAQDIRCLTVEYNKYLDSLNPSRPKAGEFEKWLSSKQKKAKEFSVFSASSKQKAYVIPVVVHIIHNGEPVGQGTNISDEQVYSQIEVLNEDYRRQNFDTIFTPDMFKTVASDSHIEFRLAGRDPQGNATSGIVRVRGSKTSYSYPSDDKLLKSESYWPSADYLNLWVCELVDALGYAQYPITDLPGTFPPYEAETDGVVIDYGAFGSSLKGSFPELKPNFDRGRTATHEIGHYLSLRHIWADDSGGCDLDDYCDDTPLQADAHYSCTTASDFVSCGTQNMYQNYLDYSWDQCMNIFTNDQISRMQTVLDNSPRRNSLLNSPGLLPPNNARNDIAVTGIVQPATISCNQDPQPVFTVRNLGVNNVYSVAAEMFIDNQFIDSARITLLMAPGDLKDISFNQVHADNGPHLVKISITEVNDSADINMNDNIFSKNFFIDDHTDNVPVRNDFETNDINQLGWSVFNPDTAITWEVTPVQVDLSTNYSAVIKFYDYDRINQMDWLLSPVLDFSNYSIITMGFSYSYAYRPGNNDFIQVKLSADCGESFPYVLFQSTGDQLTTRTSDSPWAPLTQADWKREVLNLDEFAGNRNVRVAFLGVNGNGNNLYIDNIEFYVTGFSSDLNLPENSIRVFPNPVNGYVFNVVIVTDKKQDVTLVIIDSMGRVVKRNVLTGVLNQAYEVNMEGTSSGIYIIQAIGETFTSTQRLIMIR
jgi:hypothetical protein